MIRKLILLLVPLMVLIGCEKNNEIEKQQPENHDSGKTDNGGGSGSEEDKPGEGGEEDKPVVGVSCLTLDATEIESYSARLNGKVVAEDESILGGELILPIFRYTNDPKTEPAKWMEIQGMELAPDGSFSVVRRNLEPSTTYYYQAVAHCFDERVLANEQGPIFEGEVKSFTTAEKPMDPSVSGGVVELTEISAVIECWMNPDPDHGAVHEWGIYLDEYSAVSVYSRPYPGGEKDENGHYLTEVTGLEPGKTYYYRSFVRTSNYDMGEVRSFTTPEIDVKVFATGVTDVSEYSFTLNGKLQIHSIAEFEPQVWFRLRGAWPDSYYTEMAPDSTFSVTVNDLPSGAEYYWRACADIYGKTYSSEEMTVSTRPVDGTVELLPVENLTEFTATLKARIVTDVSPSISRSAKFFWYDGPWNETEDGVMDTDGSFWSPESLVRLKGKEVQATLQDDGTFSIDLDGLAYDRDYHYVAMATLAGYYDIYSPVGEFHTPNLMAEVVTLPVTDATDRTATLGGKLNIWSSYTFSSTVWFLYINEADASRERLLEAGQKVGVSADADGNFSTLWYFTTGENYSYMACAKVHDKTLYGEVEHFTIKDIQAEISLDPIEQVYEKGVTITGKLTLQEETSTQKTVVVYCRSDKSTLDELASTSSYYVELAQDGSFSVTIERLTPGTKYYCAAKAFIGTKNFVTDVHSFTTSTVTIEVLPVENLKETSATLCAKITVTGAPDPDWYGEFKYWKKGSSYDQNPAGVFDSNGKLTLGLTGLKPATEYEYYVQVRIRNEWYWTDTVSFTTEDINVTMTTLDATDVYYTYANLHGTLNVVTEGITDPKIFFIYGKTGTDESVWTSVDASPQGDGSYAARTPYTEPASNYSYKFAFKGMDRTVYGTAKQFTTKTPASGTPSGAVRLWTFATRDDGSQYEIFWADRNVDASSAQDPGGYFAWGETQAKDNYVWPDYKWCHYNPDTREYYLTKYCATSTAGQWYSEVGNPPDNILELEPEDDVAHVRLGGGWRMPYQREWTALKECCDLTWTEREGIVGMECRSKAPSRTEVIFIPAGGDHFNVETFWSTSYNRYGYYWSRDINTSNAQLAGATQLLNTYIWEISAYGPVISENWGPAYRYIGFNVRPVTE